MAAYASRKVVDTAKAIQRYLSNRPNASETVDGIAKWWLLRQRFEDSIQHVQEALNYLENSGVVTRERLSDGKEIYRQSLH